MMTSTHWPAEGQSCMAIDALFVHLPTEGSMVRFRAHAEALDCVRFRFRGLLKF